MTGPEALARPRAVQMIVHGMRDRLAEAGFRSHADLLATLGPDDLAPPAGRPVDLPVLHHLGGAVHSSAELAAAVAALGRTLTWTRTAAYVDHPPNPRFLDRYAHATLASRPADPPTGTAAVVLGLLLLGPDVHYPPHRHPAEEIYLPLGEARWVHDDSGRYRTEPAGAVLHHRPWQPHGMRTTAEPMLAVYLWTGEVETSSEFC